MDKDTRAARAKTLLEDPVLTEAIDLVRQAIHESFESVDPLVTENECLIVTPHTLLAIRLRELNSIVENLEYALRDQEYTAYIEEADGREASRH